MVLVERIPGGQAPGDMPIASLARSGAGPDPDAARPAGITVPTTLPAQADEAAG